MQKLFPFLKWVKSYEKSFLPGDLSAGLTVGVMLIPQGMAYALLAGLPPIYGLYASTIPLIIYALFGTSRHLAIGPVAIVALLISSGVSSLAAQGTAEYILLAILLALLVGLIQFMMGIFKLGFLINFLSHPVISGFTSAAAIIIGLSQLKHILGLNIENGKFYEIINSIGSQVQNIHIATLVIGLASIFLLIIFKKISGRIPGALLAVILGISMVYFCGLQEEGVRIIKDVPSGFPSFSIPVINLESILKLTPIAFAIAFVGFIESIAIAKAIQSKHKNYKIDPNQELIGLGIANIVGSFFKSFPVTGGFSRTAVNDQAGARTGLASVISAILVITTLLFLTSYFFYLPYAVLGAIIIVAVIGLIDIKEALHLWQNDKKDFVVFMVTALSTLILGIEEGITVGVVLSLIILIYKSSNPHIAELGLVPDSEEFRNVNRFSDLITYQNILVIRFDGQIFFANGSALHQFIQKKIEEKPQLEFLVLDFSAVTNLDSSAVHLVQDIIEELTKGGIKVIFSNVKGPVRDILKKNRIMKDENKDSFYLSNYQVFRDIIFKERKDYTKYVTQTKK
ncbi:SulP family inorganic anion transporter [Portibacter marinus]|uniref:SulP family inorganic anion transporter n=1 Tax=Portibacter marinus TaxID=2898660 RepID=UPI001F23CAC6|nr:solute carrier family 26 protein [Portibacter marinus]